MTYSIRPADAADLGAVLALRKEAERWLAEHNIRQWTPDYDDYAQAALAEFVASGAAWVVEDSDRQVIATLSLNGPDPDFWGWAEPVDQANAVYLGKMIVARSHSGKGIGDALLNWASRRAADVGKKWVRIDVRRDNNRLHRYYLDRGFEHVRTYHSPGRETESGWLAQRPAGTVTATPVDLSGQT